MPSKRYLRNGCSYMNFGWNFPLILPGSTALTQRGPGGARADHQGASRYEVE